MGNLGGLGRPDVVSEGQKRGGGRAPRSARLAPADPEGTELNRQDAKTAKRKTRGMIFSLESWRPWRLGGYSLCSSVRTSATSATPSPPVMTGGMVDSAAGWDGWGSATASGI